MSILTQCYEQLKINGPLIKMVEFPYIFSSITFISQWTIDYYCSYQSVHVFPGVLFWGKNKIR